MLTPQGNSSTPTCVQGLPSWQVLLVDLRCHGESAQLEQQPAPPHSVESSAKDTLTLLSRLKIFPEALVGHSFGGKVVLRWVLHTVWAACEFVLTASCVALFKSAAK